MPAKPSPRGLTAGFVRTLRARWWSGLERPSAGDRLWFSLSYKPVLSRRVRWSWWRPIGWVVETRYADGSSSKEWARPSAGRLSRPVGARPTPAADRTSPGPLCWAGAGSELWRVRVDLFVPEDSAAWVGRAAQGLRALLTGGGGGVAPGDYGVDQGLGVTDRSVVGLLFWVRADDVGRAAVQAVETARAALADQLQDAPLYDVTVIPEGAVAKPDDPFYPAMPD